MTRLVTQPTSHGCRPPRTLDEAAAAFLQQLHRHFQNDHPDIFEREEVGEEP